MNDESEIRQTITRWVDAIRACDLDGVLAAHTDDIVMFDVPPPYDGIRGLAAYRDSWPPFFEFISAGATFEVVELDVVAGQSAGYAHGLLRCGRPEDFAAKPGVRLRITLGLRKVDGRWLIAHEHHSFPTQA
ncbi:SgcJ/EcaC family oxidoreductase [Mycobacterium sp. SMC-4]|uniref:YybH family protein n=1 Tax=Mycobacterium sp. SMC-4 TaxID=2857059 RepID=UPI0021B1CFD1|nr:SgcJ/EcaC family oxidoreductase [Mycobacterium sp. SMC-4]UXA18358.1 SgcJ/EcaC family oxidoreductase [Mycobacterium sp. SMC-4]